ncbi:MAG: glycosyltransferase family 39 protein [Candidatus Eremiobacteraeota bacterium]|nr:glycosyltransferase family 39 protein [Candidatus Eremiobacteraeota bacterium]
MADRVRQLLRNEVTWLLSALLVGTVLRCWNLSAASLNSDEAFSFALGSLPLQQLPALLAGTDFHPPLFYALTHALLVSVPKPRWDYRVVSVLFGMTTIVATWGAARRMLGPLVASLAAVAVALQPALIQYDRTYRMYALVVALVTLSFWLLVEAQAAVGRRRLWLLAGYACVAVALVYTYYLCALVLAVQLCYALTRRPIVWEVVGAQAIAVVAFLPWLPVMLRQLPLGGLALTRPGLDAGLTASVANAFAAGLPEGWLGWSNALLPALAVGAVIVVGGWVARGSALPFWLGVLPLQVVLSIALSKNLAYFPRYLLMDVPALCIAFAAIIAMLSDQRRAVAAAALALGGLIVGLVASFNVLFDPYYQFPDWYAINAVMLQRATPGDAVVLDAGYERLVVQDYTAFRRRDMAVFMNPGDFKPVLAFAARHAHARIWYLEHQHFYWDPQRRIAAALSAQRRVLFLQRWPHHDKANDVTLILFDRAGAMP